VNQVLDYAVAEFESSKDHKNNYKTYLPHLISIATELSTKIKEMIIFQKYLGLLHTPKEELAGRHKTFSNSTSILNQVDEYLSKELKFDFLEEEKEYNFTLT